MVEIKVTEKGFSIRFKILFKFIKLKLVIAGRDIQRIKKQKHLTYR